MKACHEVANKCALVAWVDYGRNNLSIQIVKLEKLFEKKLRKSLKSGKSVHLQDNLNCFQSQILIMKRKEVVIV